MFIVLLLISIVCCNKFCFNARGNTTIVVNWSDKNDGSKTKWASLNYTCGNCIEYSYHMYGWKFYMDNSVSSTCVEIDGNYETITIGFIGNLAKMVMKRN